MKCKDIQEYLIAYAEGILDETQDKEIKQHLAGCEECRHALEDYQSIKGRLHSLGTIPGLPDPKDAIFSEIDSLEKTGTAGIRRFRPAFIAIPVLLIIFAAVAIPLTGIPSGPEGIIAKAAAATDHLKSFHAEKDEYYQWTEDDELTFSYHIECEYIDPDRYHFLNEAKPHKTPYAYVGARTTELILVEEQVYSKGTTMRQDREYFDQLDLTEALTSGYVDTLIDIKTLDDEIIDGVLCYHLKGTVDPEKLLAFVKPNFRNMHERLLKNGIPVSENFDEWFTYWERIQRNEVTTLEFWISKDDYIYRQWKETITPTENYPRNVTEFYYAESYGRVSDLNEEIIIEPPLDENGELLTGWIVNPLLD